MAFTKQHKQAPAAVPVALPTPPGYTIVTTAQLAKLLGVSSATISEWARFDSVSNPAPMPRFNVSRQQGSTAKNTIRYHYEECVDWLKRRNEEDAA